MCGPLRRLRYSRDPSVGKTVEGLHHQLRTELGELAFERTRRRVGREWHPCLRQDRTGVDPGIHLHDGDAGLAIAAENGPFDRRPPAMPWPQRRVDVEG